ncbi:MAG: HNH endonuclease [Actinomycetota bacterium]|nr:HNH endonuclease [Actinomycetota bacterium]
MCSTAQSLLDRLGDDLSQLGQTAAVERGAAGAGDRISALLTARAQVEALLLDEVAAFDGVGAYVEAGTSTAASWLRASGRLTRREASGTVHQARELRNLTITARALSAGEISRAHATEIIKAKQRSCLDADSFRRYEEILVELAMHASADEVRSAVRHLVDAEAPDRDKALLDALADRSFTLRQVGDLVKVDAMIDKLTAEALTKGIEALSRRTPGDERDWHVRRADAFSEIVMLGLESGQLPQQGRVKPHVDLTLTLDQLRGIDGSGPLLRRFGQIPVATAQRLSCDAVLTRFVTDPHGEVLDVGRSCRLTNTALNKAVAHMYDTCAYPNCATPVTACEIHHLWWWSKGGGTDLWNLLPLCKHHHMFVHEYGYHIQTGLDPGGGTLKGPGRWRFVSPTGRPIPDHRTTLRHYVEQLTLMPDSPDPPPHRGLFG